MDQEIIDKINTCFQNSKDQRIMLKLLVNAGVYEVDDLEMLNADDFYNKGIDNFELQSFFGRLQASMAVEFYNTIQSIFDNPDQRQKVVQTLEKHNIIDEETFMQSNQESCGLKIVQYRKLRKHYEQNSYIKFQVPTIKNKQPQGSFLQTEQGLHIYKYNCEQFDKNDAKIILLVGEVGSGKTKLVNFMANYLQDVQLKDPYRYKMIDEKNSQRSQNQSLTQKVTQYYIRGVNGKPKVIVVDTPGFCGIRDEDQKILQQLGTFVQTLKDLHLVGFVLTASDNKHTVKQQYIFSSILQIFGKNIAENIVTFLTFADASSQPPALVALKAQDSPFQKLIHQIKEPWYFEFNNSALYSDPKSQLTEAFWNIGVKSLDALFQKKVSSIPRKQLVQTGLVISETETLHYMVNGLQRQLDQILQYIDALKDSKRQIELNKSNIEHNITFQVNIKIPACPKLYPYTKHSHDPFKHVPIMIDKTTTYQDRLNSYNSAIQSENQFTALITSPTNKLRQAYEQAIKLSVTIVACMDKLDQIALIQPKCKNQIQYIEIMEITEQNTKSDGWQSRLKLILIEQAYEKSGKFQELMVFAQQWISKKNWF